MKLVPAPTTYVCPMHPDVTSDAEGTCPKCGMRLVPATSANTDGHAHEHRTNTITRTPTTRPMASSGRT